MFPGYFVFLGTLVGACFSCFMLLFSLFSFHRRASGFFLNFFIMQFLVLNVTQHNGFSRPYHTPLPSLSTFSHLCLDWIALLSLSHSFSVYLTLPVRHSSKLLVFFHHTILCPALLSELPLMYYFWCHGFVTFCSALPSTILSLFPLT